MNIIRSDRLGIKADTAEQREALQATLNIYRDYVRDLMGVIATHWPRLGQCSDNAIVAPVEALIHPTANRPVVRYAYFARWYYKFPSYLRRAAIMDAAGQVRSFMTRYASWQSGHRDRSASRPPRLTCGTGTFPSLYSGQCFRFDADRHRCRIKVRHQGDWVWRAFRIQGKPRYMPHGTMKSPALIVRGKRWSLSVPVTTQVTLPDKSRIDRVLAVDVGINTAATWVVVDATGTVLDRGFLDRRDKDRAHQIMARIRSAAVQHTRHGNRLPPGFKAADHRRLHNLSHNEAHQISRQLIDTAVAHNCQAVVVENLKGWHPRAGRRRSTLKQRFHRWFHRQLAACIEPKLYMLGAHPAMHSTGRAQSAAIRVMPASARFQQANATTPISMPRITSRLGVCFPTADAARRRRVRTGQSPVPRRETR